ncbi:MAG: hypothetical protein Q4A08_04155 [Bacteroidales bacterium]|nr:hypothetical protein [Bacteroidales bacterium]
METSTLTSKIETFSIQIPKVDIKRFKGLMKVMGWTFSKNDAKKVEPETMLEEWTEEEERDAFLYTSRVNAAKMCSKYL